MTGARYECCDRLRRAAVAAHPALNGIDWLDVLDLDAPPGVARQQTLLVHLLKPIDAALTALLAGGEAAAITGGRRLPARALWAAPALALPASLPAAERAWFEALPDADRVIVVRTDTHGDYSRFALALRRSALDGRPPEGFDPRLSEVEFSFKVECPQEFDCKPAHDCPEPAAETPELDYLARDYDGYRRLLLGRLRTLMPDWRGDNAADLLVTLVEAIAYRADQLSYKLDAAGPEAYLATARHRASLRRHALLVDYRPSQGCNARTVIQLRLAQGVPAADIPVAGLSFLTASVERAGRVPADPRDTRHAALRAAGALVFEPLDPEGRVQRDPGATVRIDPVHDTLPLYAWGDQRCCLPKGATAATLAGHFPNLAAGDLLLFEEVIGPETGAAEDADRSHRHLVRLTSVSAFDGADPRTDPLNDMAVTEIAWDAADALPFPLCVSAELGDDPVTGVSVARGNLLLADHGESVSETLAPDVPVDWLRLPAPASDHCAPVDPDAQAFRPARFRPALTSGPLSHAPVRRGAGPDEDRTFDPAAPATALFEAESAHPAIALTADGETWRPRPDLLLSGPDDAHFVVEMDAAGGARLRFGDGQFGRRPAAGQRFVAAFRIGTGPVGNVGADSLLAVASDDPRIVGCRNPLPGWGGASPETAAQIRRRAPFAFRRQERAVTLADWAEVAERLPGVSRAAAITRWTGSWRTATVLIDREDGAPITSDYARDVARRLDRFRIATRDLAIGRPKPVTLVLKLLVCVCDGAVRADVEAGVRRALGSGLGADRRPALFHPDRLSFGQTVYLSPVYAAARAVRGVCSVEALAFGRADAPDDPAPLVTGRLTMGATEIARLDSDPDFPEHGVLALVLKGGR